MFYGMPIHIIRDVALTIRSFYKRVTDFVRYRQATRDMHDRYPDATPTEVSREDVCIICREDIRPWIGQAASDPILINNGRAETSLPVSDERLRPKKLPCGHILHFACLRSWLERQQNCPTCRRPVLAPVADRQNQVVDLPNQQAQPEAHANDGQHRAPQAGQQPLLAQNVFNLGPLRIAFGARQRLQHPQPQGRQNPSTPTTQRPPLSGEQMPLLPNAAEFQRQVLGIHNRPLPGHNHSNVPQLLSQLEQQLLRDINGLRVQQSQLFLVRALQGELNRLRNTFSSPHISSDNAMDSPNQANQLAQSGPGFASSSQQQPMGRDHPDLPSGMTLPTGWSILPLRPVSEAFSSTSGERPNAGTTDCPPGTHNANPSMHTSTTNSIAEPSSSASPTHDQISKPSSSHGQGTMEPDDTGRASASLNDGPRLSWGELAGDVASNEQQQSDEHEGAPVVDNASPASFQSPSRLARGGSQHTSSTNHDTHPIARSGEALPEPKISTRARDKGKGPTVEDFDDVGD